MGLNGLVGAGAFALAFGALAKAGAAGPGADVALPDADAIFAHARTELAARACRGRLDYVITIAARRDRTILENRFRATYVFDRDHLVVHTISEEEARAASPPRGANVVVELFGMPLVGLSRALTQQVNHDPPPIDFLGVPFLKPIYSFGLIPAQAGSPQSSQDASTLRIIGSTSSRARNYTVSLVGVEQSGGAAAYHLHLEPVRDPQKYRVRDMWVDTDTYSTLQIQSAGNFERGPSTRVPWITTFREVDGCRVVDREIALRPLDFGRAGVFDNTTVSFEPVRDDSAERVPLLFIPQRHGDDAITEPDR